jgi:hypothetical protein
MLDPLAEPRIFAWTIFGLTVQPENVGGAKVGAGMSRCTSGLLLDQADGLLAASQEKVFPAYALPSADFHRSMRAAQA